MDVNAAVGITYHIGGFAKILPSQPNQQGQTLTTTIVYTLSGEPA